MDRQQIHFEVFARRPGSAGWRLEIASEDRARAFETAEQLMAGGNAAAVKVTKEVLDTDSGEFSSVTVLSRGAPEPRQRAARVEDDGPPCVAPSDLYTVHARRRISVLLDAWLGRNQATAFELLHRPDLAERLDSSGTELLHAIQKVAAPEAQSTGRSVHELMRHFQSLTERAIARLIQDGRRGAFPDLERESFAAACRRALGEPDAAYRLGGAVAIDLARCRGPAGKIERLLDLAAVAPDEREPRAAALNVIETVVGEIIATRAGVDAILGEGLEPGEAMAAMARLVSGSAFDALARADPIVATMLPPLKPGAARLGEWLEAEGLDDVRVALGQRVLRELTGPKRLHHGDARAEITALRALAMVLTVAAGPLLPLEDVRAAFVERSKRLVSGDFIEQLLGVDRPALDQARDLVWLLENVTGPVNRRRVGECLHALVGSLRFETEMCGGPHTPSQRLVQLAELQREVGRVGGANGECRPAQETIGAVAGLVEAHADLTALLGRANGPVLDRLTALLRLASGVSAPHGPAADRARTQAMRLLRSEDARHALAASPESLTEIQALARAARAA